MYWLKRLLAAQDGSIAVMGALALVATLGMSGFAVELGNGYTAKVRNQRVADMAALAAAAAYSASSQSLAAAQQVASDVVVANGLPTSAATITPDSATSPTTITVSIATSVPIRLAAALIGNGTPSYSVTSAATAALGINTSIGCITALDNSATRGVSLSGAATLSVSGCAVNSNSAIQLDGSASLTARNVSTNSSVTLTGAASLTAQTITAGSSITKPQYSGTLNGTQRPNTPSPTADPLAGNAALTAAFASIGSVVAPTTPVMPTAPGFTAPPANSNWSFVNSSSDFNALPSTNPVKANCTYSGAAFSCAAGTYAINNLTIPGGVSVTFQGPSTISVYGTVSNGGSGLRFNGGAGSTFKFRNGFDSGTSGVVFGAGDVYIGGATTLQGTSGFGDGAITVSGMLTTGGSSTVTIGNGAHAFGGITVGGSGRLTVGAGNLTVAGAIATGGSTTTSFGAGAYVVGKDGNGYSINHLGNTLTFGAGGFSGTGGIFVNGSSTLTFGAGDLTLGTSNSNGAIYVSGSATLTMGAGSLNANGAVSTAGSSNVTFGAGSSHNINGNVTINGGATLGAGRYTINGNFTKSASMAVSGSDVTIIAAGTFSTGGSASLTLTAPSSAGGGGIPGIVFASQTTGASTIDGSSQNTFGGIFYMPNSNLTVSGAGSVGSSTCFALVVKTVTISGGSSANTGCTMPSTGASSTPRLIR